MARERLGPVLGHAFALSLACLATFLLVTGGLGLLPDAVSPADARLGGMWAVISTVFVFRETRSARRGLATSRLVATLASFVLCQLYLLLFGFSAVGLAVLVGIGYVVVHLLGRPQDAVTVSITTTVVLVVAGVGPPDTAAEQPLLRLVDTAVGVVVGLLAAAALGAAEALARRRRVR